MTGRAAHPDPTEDAAPRGVAAVITICSRRKKVPPTISATAVSLPLGLQPTVQSAWLENLRSLRPTVAAEALYGGRGFGLAIQAARKAQAKLYIISAGLGLIAATQRVPSYGLTVAKGRDESVASRVAGEFDPAMWFSNLLDGPYSRQWANIVAKPGRILVSLTRPYAEMVGEILVELGPTAISRLRIFGASLSASLPAALTSAIAPYDGRLDTILPGTRADFPQRALLHFVNLVATKESAIDRAADFAEVASALEKAALPGRIRRPRRTDEEILGLISTRLESQVGIARILRALRVEDGVACEQSRFSRLYRTAVSRRAVT